MVKLTSLFFFVQICVYCNVNANFDFQIIGIFSICGDKYAENELNRKAFKANEVFHKHGALTTEFYSLSTEPQPNFKFKSFDICFDDKELTSLLISIALDEEFNTLEGEKYVHYDIYMQPKELEASRISKIVAIATYMNEEQLQKTLEVVLHSYTLQ